MATLDVGRRRRRRPAAPVVSAPVVATTSALTLPEPSTVASLAYEAIQTRLELIHDSLSSIVRGLRIDVLSSFGETKVDEIPRITSMDVYDASLRTEGARLISQLEKQMLATQRTMASHTKFAGKNYVGTVIHSTDREREQREADIARRREQLDRDRQAIEELERSLPGGPRPNRRQRR